MKRRKLIFFDELLPGLIVVRGCYLLLLLFLRQSEPFFGPDRIRSRGLLNFCGSTEDFSFIIQIIFQRVLGGVIGASSRLPHLIDVHQWNGEGRFIPDAQFCSVYFVMAVCEVATHAPKVFTDFFTDPLFFILLRVSLGGHFAAWGLRKIEEIEIRLHMETRAFLPERLLGACTV